VLWVKIFDLPPIALPEPPRVSAFKLIATWNSMEVVLGSFLFPLLEPAFDLSFQIRLLRFFSVFGGFPFLRCLAFIPSMQRPASGLAFRYKTGFEVRTFYRVCFFRCFPSLFAPIYQLICFLAVDILFPSPLFL